MYYAILWHWQPSVGVSYGPKLMYSGLSLLDSGSPSLGTHLPSLYMSYPSHLIMYYIVAMRGGINLTLGAHPLLTSHVSCV